MACMCVGLTLGMMKSLLVAEKARNLEGVCLYIYTQNSMLEPVTIELFKTMGALFLDSCSV